MTEYEIMDTRTNLVGQMITMTKYLLSVTLAVFAAAFYGGAQLDIFSTVALFIFYAMNGLFVVGAMMTLKAQMEAVAGDAARLRETHTDASLTIQAKVMDPANGLIAAVNGLALFAVVGFAFYLGWVVT
jgi:hypothetical protein